jgi:sugar lactone lactonase YvrE
MKSKKRNRLKAMNVLFLFVLLFCLRVGAQEGIIDFDSDRWVKAGAQVVKHLDRKSLMGTAYLKDVEFENGIIEVDIAVTGARSYPGINFRIQSPENYEHFYIRPHRAGLYPDALQYTPYINGMTCWQLYNGDGYTAGAMIPENKWIHVKLEVMGKQARVYLNNGAQPAMVITDLKHGISKGTIGLGGPTDKTAYFSNFKYKVDNYLKFDPPPDIETPPGMYTEWQLSQTFKLSQIDPDRYPNDQELSEIKWQTVKSEPSGLVNIARYNKRTGREPDCVFAKTIIHSDKDKVLEFKFGYSDAIVIFFNGHILFTGNSAYTQRDPSFLGIVGLFDSVHMPLKKGENEVLLLIAEVFGGWAFICQDGDAVFLHKCIKKMWENTSDFKMPESVVYDADRDVLYVSNFDGYGLSGRQFISKVSMDGKIKNLEWVTGLSKPTGMTIFKDKLYVVERGNLVEIDLKTGEVRKRYPIPQPTFPNDVTVDQSGNFYISDSSKSVIFKLSNGTFEEWLNGGEISRPNGLLVHKNQLIVGNNGDNCLKAVNLADKKISTIVNLGKGIIDGIKTDKEGNYLVSHYEGKVYRITPSGQVTKLLDTSVPPIRTADFEYIIGKNLFIIPSLEGNRVVTYQLIKM